MTPAAPSVTVLIACFNVAPYLEATLESVRAQRFADFEVLMVDDGSTDGTAEVMKRFAAEDLRFKPILLPSNQGVVAARNAALAVARGTYVAPLDGDDCWTPDALAFRLKLAERHPTANVIATEFAWFETAVPLPPYVGRVGLGPRARRAFASCYDSGNEVLLADPFELVATLHFAWTGAMLIRRDAITAVGNFDPAFSGPEDTLLWLKLALHGAFVFSPTVTAFYRQRPGSLVTTFRGPKELHYLKVLDEIKKCLSSKTHKRAVLRLAGECHYIASLYHRRTGNRAMSRRHALAAVTNTSGQMGYWKNLLASLIAA